MWLHNKATQLLSRPISTWLPKSTYLNCINTKMKKPDKSRIKLQCLVYLIMHKQIRHSTLFNLIADDLALYVDKRVVIFEFSQSSTDILWESYFLNFDKVGMNIHLLFYHKRLFPYCTLRIKKTCVYKYVYLKKNIKWVTKELHQIVV